MSTNTQVMDSLQQAYRLWHDGKADQVGIDFWLSLVDDNVDWRSISDGCEGMEFSRACGCKDQVRRYFMELGQDWEMIEYRIDDFVANDDRAVALGHCSWRHRRTGKVVDTPKADYFRFRDGKIVQFMEYFDTAQASAATQ